jgi:hypothetical protein
MQLPVNSGSNCDDTRIRILFLRTWFVSVDRGAIEETTLQVPKRKKERWFYCQGKSSHSG